jgi:hypothetical protein
MSYRMQNIVAAIAIVVLVIVNALAR